MQSFTFNGLTSSSINGLYVKEMPSLVLAERYIETIEVAGRNGSLHIDNQTYKPYEMTIVCVLTDLTQIDTIKGYLTGTHTLTISTVADREFIATVKNQIDFKKYLSVLKEFPIQFEVQPISRSTTETTVTKTADGTFTVAGTYGVYPTLEIKGSGAGSVTLNGTVLTITGMSSTAIIIDCELMNATQGVNSANSQITCDVFPKLVIGTNSVSMVGATEVKIKYKAGYL